MDDPEQTDSPPAFEDPFSEGDIEQQIYAVVLQTRSPTAAGTVAERVGCDQKTARKYLQWFEKLGIVTAHKGRPVTYERNDAYFRWRRVNELAATHSRAELESKVQDLTERVRMYEDRYEADSPADVDAVAVAERDENRPIDEVYDDLTDWATARQDRERFERARQQRTDSGASVFG